LLSSTFFARKPPTQGRQAIDSAATLQGEPDLSLCSGKGFWVPDPQRRLEMADSTTPMPHRPEAGLARGLGTATVPGNGRPWSWPDPMGLRGGRTRHSRATTCGPTARPIWAGRVLNDRTSFPFGIGFDPRATDVVGSLSGPCGQDPEARRNRSGPSAPPGVRQVPQARRSPKASRSPGGRPPDCGWKSRRCRYRGPATPPEGAGPGHIPTPESDAGGDPARLAPVGLGCAPQRLE